MRIVALPKLNRICCFLILLVLSISKGSFFLDCLAIFELVRKFTYCIRCHCSNTVGIKVKVLGQIIDRCTQKGQLYESGPTWVFNVCTIDSFAALFDYLYMNLI